METKPWHAQYDPGVPPEIDIPEQALFVFLQQAAREQPQAVCVRFDGQDLTYAQVDDLSDRAARSLRAMGVQRGEAVALCLPNLPQFVVLYYAILKAGGVVTAINPRFGAAEMQSLLGEVEPRVAFVACESTELLLRTHQFIHQERVIFTSTADAAALGECLRQQQPFDYAVKNLLDFLRMESALELPPVAAEDDCIFQYSGGTTGTPKAAAATHRSLVANTLQFRAWLSTLHPGQERTLVAIPLYHVYGMVIGMSVSIALRGTIVLHDERIGMEGLLRLAEQEKVSLFPAVPHLLELLLQQPLLQENAVDLSAVKVIISGASPLRVGCQEAWQRLLSNGRIVEGYGLSEAPTATHCNPVQGSVRPGSIGLPLPGVEARVVSLQDGFSELPAGEKGELVLRSPQVMRAYLKHPEESARALRDGWLHTGDIAVMDTEGYFTIVDRLKDVIKVSGFQVWPAEVEAVLAHHPAVREAGVVGVPDALRGEKVIAWVALQPGHNLTVEQAREWCKRWLAAYKAPRELRFIEKLPRSSLGKLLRRELRAMTD